MYPLKQIPDEESLLELSTVPESQVEYLHSERVHDSTHFHIKFTDPIVHSSGVVNYVLTSLLPVPCTSRNHLVHE